MDTLEEAFPFGIGTIEEIFQTLGICPNCIVLLNNFVIAGAILVAVAFNIIADTPSGPLALFASRESNKSKTSSSHRRSLGQRDGSGEFSLASGGTEVLKH